MKMAKPVILSSQNRTMHSSIEHYLEKSHYQKESNSAQFKGTRWSA